MGLRHTRVNESRCHPERSEGSAVPVRRELMQILRFAQNGMVRGFFRSQCRPELWVKT